MNHTRNDDTRHDIAHTQLLRLIDRHGIEEVAKALETYVRQYKRTRSHDETERRALTIIEAAAHAIRRQMAFSLPKLLAGRVAVPDPHDDDHASTHDPMPYTAPTAPAIYSAARSIHNHGIPAHLEALEAALYRLAQTHAADSRTAVTLTHAAGFVRKALTAFTLA